MSEQASTVRSANAQRWIQGTALAAAVSLAACSTTGAPSAAPGPAGPVASSSSAALPPNQPQILQRDGITPPFMAGQHIVRIGILLPFAEQPDAAQAIYQAAELAVFDYGDASTLLIPRESGATAAEASANARLLMRDGADVILGPLQRDAMKGAADAARPRRVPVIGFSSDQMVAGDGVYILSMPLEEDVRRIVDFTMSKGVRNFALLTAESDYGRRIETALRTEVASRGGALAFTEFYQRNEQAAAAAARKLAQEMRGASVQAIMIAESGPPLRATGPALLIGGVNLERVQLLGTSAWAGGDAQREPTLARGWYVGPDPQGRATFEDHFKAAYGGRAPSRFASFGYDAVMAAIQMTQGQKTPVSPQAIERQEGFVGADGVFRFRHNGSIERGLAVMEVRPQGPVAIDPAPKTFRTN